MHLEESNQAPHPRSSLGFLKIFARMRTNTIVESMIDPQSGRSIKIEEGCSLWLATIPQPRTSKCFLYRSSDFPSVNFPPFVHPGGKEKVGSRSYPVPSFLPSEDFWESYR